MPLLRIRSLYWKIFLGVWLAMMLTVAATTIAVRLLSDQSHAEKHRQNAADTALAVYENGGTRALRHWLRRQHRGKARHTFMVDAQGKDLLGKPIPSFLASAVETVGTGTTEIADGKHRFWLKGLSTEGGSDYVYITRLKHHSRSDLWRRAGAPPFRGIWLFSSLIITGLISFGLARNITAPLARLRLTAQQISHGNFDSRVDTSITKRGDEIADLGETLDSMSAQIKTLLSTQQRMLRDVSHELRSPLARLEVALELARNAPEGKAGKALDRIGKEAARLEELIAEVLSFVRMQTPGAKPTMRQENLNRLIEHIVETTNFEAEAQNKKVTFTATEEVSAIFNEELLHRAVENIIRNGVRYTPENTDVEVTLKLDSDGITLTIKDQGPGVPDSHLAHLFEPFYRESDARDRESGGYGLGLAIAEQAVRIHGGTISACNGKESDGFIMQIKLPPMR